LFAQLTHLFKEICVRQILQGIYDYDGPYDSVVIGALITSPELSQWSYKKHINRTMQRVTQPSSTYWQHSLHHGSLCVTHTEPQ